MCTEGGMDKEVVVHLYKGILTNPTKKRIWVTWAEMDEPTACYVEWSKSQSENQIWYLNVYMGWNPEKWHCLTYFQGRNRGIDGEHVCGHNRGGEGKLNWENSIETQYITMCKILTDSWWKDAVWHRKLTLCCLTTWRSGMGSVVGGFKREGIYVHFRLIHIIAQHSLKKLYSN